MSSFSNEKLLPPRERIKHINEKLLAKGGINAEVYDLMASTHAIRNTFCYAKWAEVLQLTQGYDNKVRKSGIAPLAFYIIECIKSLPFGNGLGKDVTNTIICYQISQNLYGYVFIKDGTIYSRDGEATGDKQAIKEIIISLIKDYNKSTNTDRKINTVSATEEFADIQDSLYGLEVEYIPLGYDYQNQRFEFDSEAMFWNKKQLRRFNKVKLINPKVKAKTYNKLAIASVILISIGAFLYYEFFMEEPQAPPPPPPHSGLMKGSELIKKCFGDTDNLFTLDQAKGQYNWYLKEFKCGAKGLTTTFATTDTITLPQEALEDLKKQLQEKNIAYDNRSNTFILANKFPINDNYKFRGNALEFLKNLNVNTLDLGLKTTFGQITNNQNSFQIDSSLSPVYLLNSGILENAPLISIEGTFDVQTGMYKWKINGKV